jgi:pSer/pThr/pTyr-binding forkhead associated (FHA) protein
MCALLLVIKDKKQVAKAPITGNLFIIGRAPQCDLPLDESLASREHVEVVFEKGLYWVRDRASRNGTYVNGEKIKERRRLSDGDEIAVGATRLKFVWDQAGQGDGAPDDDATRVASQSDLEKIAPGQKVLEKSKVGDFDVKLRVIDGPLHGGVFRNWESPLTIGRGLENHVVLLDDAVSTAHAQIVEERRQYFIVDLKSSNGTFVDGVKVQRAQLFDGQKIKVGASTLAFDMVDLRKKRKNMKIALITTATVLVAAAAAKFFKPPDVAGQHIRQAMIFEGQGNLSKAKEEYDVALKVDPNRQEALRGMAQVNTEISDRETLATAEKEAAAENYDKAKDLCYRVLRGSPNLAQALELAGVIKTIENAKTALTARNWRDAKELLDSAQETYPKSELIRAQLDEAQMEITAEQDLNQAKDAYQHGQLDTATPLLQSIPVKSVYYNEAKEQLDQIARDNRVAGHLSKGQSLYGDGSLIESYGEVRAGLQEASDNPSLLKLQARIRQMEPLVKPLEEAEALGQQEDVDALLAYQKACSDVLGAESDPQNALHKRAQVAADRIAEKLKEVSQADAGKADESVQAGERIAALAWYDQAIKANASDQNIAALRDKLYQQIVAECKKAYQDGIVLADLGQTEMARDSFKKVLAIGIPGQDYYTKATAKLKAMNQ